MTNQKTRASPGAESKSKCARFLPVREMAAMLDVADKVVPVKVADLGVHRHAEGRPQLARQQANALIEGIQI